MQSEVAVLWVPAGARFDRREGASRLARRLALGVCGGASICASEAATDMREVAKRWMARPGRSSMGVLYADRCVPWLLLRSLVGARVLVRCSHRGSRVRRERRWSGRRGRGDAGKRRCIDADGGRVRSRRRGCWRRGSAWHGRCGERWCWRGRKRRRRAWRCGGGVRRRLRFCRDSREYGHGLRHADAA